VFKNEESFYVSDAHGDMRLIRIYEHHDTLMFEVGKDFKLSIDADGVYDIIDALTMVLESISK
jgi:hypothetical protein